MWHPSFYWIFQKIFIWLEGSDFKKFLQENSHSQIFFFMTKILFGFTQDLPLTLEVLAFFRTQDKMVFIWENNFCKTFWSLHYGFWKVLCHFQLFVLAMALVQMISPNSSLTSGSWFTSNPASWTSPCIYFPFKFYSNIFCLLFYLLEIYKGTPFSVWTFTTKLLSPPSPLNPQPRTMKIHWSPVQNFQTTSAASLDQIWQIWWNSFKTFSKNSK